MCNTLVAIDAGVTRLHAVDVLFTRPFLLVIGIHRVEIMTVTTFTRVGALHRRPYASGHGQAVCIKFFRGINGTQNLVHHFLAGLNLAHHFVHPGVGHVAVGTGCTHTAAVGVVNGFFVLLVNVLFHLVAGDAEIQCVGDFHRGVEATPEDNTNEHKEKCRAECRAENDLARQDAKFPFWISHLLSHLVAVLFISQATCAGCLRNNRSYKKGGHTIGCARPGFYAMSAW